MSNLFGKTLRNAPSDAEFISHKLLVQSGMIHQVSAGVYSYLPLAWKSLKKIEAIIRDALDSTGAQEVKLGILQPREMWQMSGRDEIYGPDMIRLNDRRDKELVLPPTNEELITETVKTMINSYKDLPIVAVMATLDKSPFSIYWDAATYPDVNSIADLKKRNVTIMLGRPDIGWKYFVAKGIMKESQMDLSDMAKPAAFISANGKLAEAGFATAEPFLYEVEIKEWGKPVKVQLLHDAGFPEYFQALAVKKEDIDKKAECLERLVPIIQRSHVEYIQNPNETNELIVKLADSYLTGWVYTMISAKFSHKQQLALDIVGNGENYFLGDFNPSRVERLVEIVGFVTDVDVSSLNPREMVTNKFIDPSIGL